MQHTIVFLENSIQQALQTLYKQTATGSIQIQQTRKEFEGQFTLVVFPLLTISKKTPEDTAREIGNYLIDNFQEIEKFNVVKGFLNITLQQSYWAKRLLYIQQTKLESITPLPIKKQNILLEYSSPNTNKPLHLGHIRNNLLGFALSEILKANNLNVKKLNLINDRGIHICKSMIAWLNYGNNETPENSNLKGDHLVGKYYVLFDKIYKQEIETLVNQGLSKEEAANKAPIFLAAQELLRKWEAGDPQTIDVWQKMNNWVYKGFEETYKKLGVDFDKFYYESETYLLGKKIVEEGLQAGIFYKKQDNSVWVNLTDVGLDEKLLLRGDGTSVYITQDLGTAVQRQAEFNADKMIYVVGNEQDYHFKVLQAILKKLGKPWADNIYHLSYGMVDLPTGKMKSREGTVVDADDLINEMTTTAEAITRQLGKVDGMTDDEIKQLSFTIGMGALKYFILKVDPRKRMLFNPAESIDFNGNTGPFIQYTYARINSLLQKSGMDVANLNLENIYQKGLEPIEQNLIQLLDNFGNMLHEAANAYSPAVVANYVYELAKTYNHFYQELPILKADDENVLTSRLILSQNTALAIKKSLKLLGIDVPQRM